MEPAPVPMSFLEFLRVPRRVPRRVPGASTFAVSLDARTGLFAAIHVAALAVMLVSEEEPVAKLAFLLTWGALNFVWLVLLRRPLISGALSLAMVAALILLSRLKHDIIWTTVNFVDVLIVDTDTIAFLLTIFPNLGTILAACTLLALPVGYWIWRSDALRVGRFAAGGGAAACLSGLVGLGALVPLDTWQVFLPGSHVSKFARSGVEAVSELMRNGLFEADSVASGRLAPESGVACQTAGRRPHIVLVHDESSFDIRAVPGVKVPKDYGPHFRSFDGKERRFLVESNGGSSWFAEYNVLAGLSSRSFGRFSYFLPRVAAGHVKRGLPHSLARCGYRTYSLYPSLGAFMSARGFHKSTGIEHFLDSRAMGARGIQPDRFYYGTALDILTRQGRDGPLFLFVYLAANHFPWTDRWRPELTPQWHDLGNPPKVDEYLRRQSASFRDYREFVARLKRDFPTDSFLIVRYGDHQPELTAYLLEPGISDDEVAQRMATFDRRYFTTYYSIDAINFRPVKTSSALETLDAPYLPLVVQELAGLALDPSFAEQKKIFERCKGIFYACGGGAEARRFNRMLMDAGLIKGL
ncbi:MAG TPA: sulfatase-like hydrolase/transferase [Xanthobacteraceae bacterium]|nr:sulfatase-like hydrolase/transferase [Xanthobacteraceae bacterium]